MDHDLDFDVETSEIVEVKIMQNLRSDGIEDQNETQSDLEKTVQLLKLRQKTRNVN